MCDLLVCELLIEDVCLSSFLVESEFLGKYQKDCDEMKPLLKHINSTGYITILNNSIYQCALR